MTRPPVPACLVTTEGAVGLGFNDRITDVVEVRDGVPIDLAVSAGGLRAALDAVSGDGSGGELVPIVGLPSEFMNHGREREAGVGDAAGDDDLRALGQRVDDGPRAEVDVGALHVGADGGQGLAGIHAFELDAAREKSVEAVHDVVAGDGGDFDLDSLALGHVEHGVLAGGGIHSAGVGDDADAPLLQIGEHAGDHVDEVAGVAGIGVARPLLLQDRHGDFGQIVERQIIDGAAAHLFDGGFERVAPEALSIRNSDHIGNARLVARCTHCRGFDTEPDGLGRGVGILLAGAGLNGAGNVDELVHRLGVRQRLDSETAPRFVFIHQDAVQADVEHAHAGRQIAHLDGNAAAKIALPHRWRQ